MTSLGGPSSVLTPLRRRARRTLVLAVALLAAAGAAGCASSGSGYAVGDVGPGGGVVFYVAAEPFLCGPVLEKDCRFLEAAPLEGDAVRVWAEDPWIARDVSGAGMTSVGSGAANTRAIVEQGNIDPDVSAAAYADTYVNNGYSDWYLPSKDEIFELYEQREVAEASERNNYWTSSGYDFNTVWNQSFVEGPQHRRLKFDQITVRPVRAF